MTEFLFYDRLSPLNPEGKYASKNKFLGSGIDGQEFLRLVFEYQQKTFSENFLNELLIDTLNNKESRNYFIGCVKTRRQIVNNFKRFIKTEQVEGVVCRSEIVKSGHEKHKERYGNVDLVDIIKNPREPLTQVELLGDQRQFVIMGEPIQLYKGDVVSLYLDHNKGRIHNNNGFYNNFDHPITDGRDRLVSVGVQIPDKNFRAIVSNDPGYFWNAETPIDYRPSVCITDDLANFDLNKKIADYYKTKEPSRNRVLSWFRPIPYMITDLLHKIGSSNNHSGTDAGY